MNVVTKSTKICLAPAVLVVAIQITLSVDTDFPFSLVLRSLGVVVRQGIPLFRWWGKHDPMCATSCGVKFLAVCVCSTWCMKEGNENTQLSWTPLTD